MELFDTHCHLDVAAFDKDRQRVLHEANARGVKQLLVPAITRNNWQSVLDLCQQHPGLYPALGLHPVMLEQHKSADITALAEQVTRTRPVAIGEIGLDFQMKTLDREKQQSLFAAQLAIAEQQQLPVVLHVRKAHDAVLQMLKRHALPGGTCHAFNGSLQQAEQYIQLGFKLGFGGMLTYPKANKLRKLARELPLSAMVLETDAPDMVGAAHQYQRNSPAYLPEVLETLAELRAEPVEAIARVTRENAYKVFQCRSDT